MAQDRSNEGQRVKEPSGAIKCGEMIDQQMEWNFSGMSVLRGGSYAFMQLLRILFPVYMKILVGDVAFGDVVFRVRRGFAIPSLSIIYANSFVYHLGLQQLDRGTFHWQQ